MRVRKINKQKKPSQRMRKKFNCEKGAMIEITASEPLKVYKKSFKKFLNLNFNYKSFLLNKIHFFNLEFQKF